MFCGTLFAVRILVDYRPALRERTGVGEFVHELVRALARQSGRRPDRRVHQLLERPAGPALASEMPSVRIVDVKVPVRALVWSWNRMEWPPVEWFAGPCDVVHSQSPLLIPAQRAAQVVTVHDLDFLRHPEQMSAEIRRDYPALARSHAARARCGDRVVALRRRRGDARAAARSRRACTSARLGGRRGPTRCAAVRQAARWPRQAHSVRGHAEPAQERRHACSRRTRACDRQMPAAPPLVLAGHRTPASARWEARCEQPPLKGHVTITGYVDPRAEDRSLCERGDAGAALVRGRLWLAGARSHGVRRAGGGVVARIAARSGGRRGDAG